MKMNMKLKMIWIQRIKDFFFNSLKNPRKSKFGPYGMVVWGVWRGGMLGPGTLLDPPLYPGADPGFPVGGGADPQGGGGAERQHMIFQILRKTA